MHLLNPISKITAKEAIHGTLSPLKVYFKTVLMVEVLIFDPSMARLREITLPILLIFGGITFRIVQLNYVQIRPNLYVALVDI